MVAPNIRRCIQLLALAAFFLLWSEAWATEPTAGTRDAYGAGMRRVTELVNQGNEASSQKRYDEAEKKYLDAYALLKKSTGNIPGGHYYVMEQRIISFYLGTKQYAKVASFIDEKGSPLAPKLFFVQRACALGALGRGHEAAQVLESAVADVVPYNILPEGLRKQEPDPRKAVLMYARFYNKSMKGCLDQALAEINGSVPKNVDKPR